MVLGLADPYLRGLFGIDAIWNHERLHLLEVNPRYTASVEVVEYTTGRALLHEHATAFTDQVPTRCPCPVDLPPKVGKGIYYASEPVCIPANMDQLETQPSIWSVPPWADIPQPGTLATTGDPLLSLMTQGPNCESLLLLRAGELDTWLSANALSDPES